MDTSMASSDGGFAGAERPLTAYQTRALPVDVARIGRFIFHNPEQSFLGDWELELASRSTDAANISQAAQQVRNGDIPVAFPTETVYGLGADATRSTAVQGIYKAKQRPADNPLIVHISSLKQLRGLFRRSNTAQDSIPQIYLPLIQKFWPGPLTILMPLTTASPFAPEVTAGLPTVGVRMPSSLLALALIHLADRPLAAPSANASSKPSPTTAAHVLHDLSGRIQTVVDGGTCNVGVESTIVDGTSMPPLILRPGAISEAMLRSCEGWQDVRSGYADGTGSSPPRAPGMKYKHYSPQAKVILVHGPLTTAILQQFGSNEQKIGILQSRNWVYISSPGELEYSEGSKHTNGADGSAGLEKEDFSAGSASIDGIRLLQVDVSLDPARGHTVSAWTVGLGRDLETMARLLFSAMRELDLKGVDVIFVEAIKDGPGGLAAAIMNRLRKAAEREIEDTGHHAHV